MFDRNAYEKRMEWYRQDRFGMFLHWGLYAIPARGEWVRSLEQMPEEEYLPFFGGLRSEGVGKSGEGGRDEICGADGKAS